VRRNGWNLHNAVLLTTRYLGQRAFGEIYGYLFMAFILGASVGGFGADVSFDRLGSYTPALIGYAGALVGAAFLGNRLGPYVYQPQPLIGPEAGAKADRLGAIGVTEPLLRARRRDRRIGRAPIRRVVRSMK
jgi:hypothetical protein